METQLVKVQYTLSEEQYRAEVSAATGPVSRDRAVEVAVGELTPEARLALLEVHDANQKYYRLADLRVPTVRLREPRAVAMPPDAAETSALLIALAEAERAQEAERAAQREREAREESERARQRAQAQEVALAAWEHDHAVARAAGLPRSGSLTGFADGHGDGYGVADHLRQRLATLRAIVASEIEAEEKAEAAAVAEWAARNGEAVLARAAREGRDVASEVQVVVEGILAARCRELIPTATVISDWYGGPDVRDDVPSPRAYEVLDALVAGRGEIGRDLPWPVQIGEIARIDVSARRDAPAVWRTGVVVAAGPASVAVLAEPLNYHAEAEEDEEGD